MSLLLLVSFVLLVDPAWTPACFGLFLLASVSRIMGSILMLTFLRAYLDLGRLRRDLPRLYALAALGNIVAGVAVPGIVGVAGNPGLLAGWGACLAAQLAVLLSYEKSFQPMPPEPVRAVDRESPEKLRDYRLTTTLMIFVGTGVFLFRVMDFHANSLLGRIYPTADQLSRFYGLFQAAGSLTAALMSAVLTPMLLDRAGVGRSLLVLPAFSFVTLVGLAVAPGLGPAIMARSLVQVLQGAILRPVLDILQSALPTGLANRLTMILSGAVIPGATIVAALALAPFADGTAHLALASLSLLATATLVALAPVLSRQYSSTLVEFLQRRGARKLPAVSLPALELDPAVMERLLGLLTTSDPEKVELAARLLERTGDRRVISLMREALVSTRSAKAARALLESHDVVKNAAVAAILIGRMEESAAEKAPGVFSGAAGHEEKAPGVFSGAAERGEKAPGVLSGAAERGEKAPGVLSGAEVTVARMDPPGAGAPLRGAVISRETPLSVLAEHLATRGAVFQSVLDGLARHADPRVAVEAIRYHLRAGFAKDRVSWLVELLGSSSAVERAAGARGLAATGDRSHIAAIITLLEDRATASAAFGALEELDRRPEAARLAVYARALPRGDREARRRAFKLIARGVPADSLPLLVALLERREPLIVREAVRALDRRWEEALPHLDRAMADPRTPAGARAEILSAWTRWRRRDRVDTALHALRGRAVCLARWTLALSDEAAVVSASRFATSARDAQASDGTGATVIARSSSPGEVLSPGTALRFLREVLAQRLAEHRRLMARGWLERAGAGDHAHVVAGLESLDPAVRSRALEALREALPAGEAAAVLPFFEIADLATLLQRLHEKSHESVSALPELSASGDPYLEAGARYLQSSPVPEGACA